MLLVKTVEVNPCPARSLSAGCRSSAWKLRAICLSRRETGLPDAQPLMIRSQAQRGRGRPTAWLSLKCPPALFQDSADFLQSLQDLVTVIWRNPEAALSVYGENLPVSRSRP